MLKKDFEFLLKLLRDNAGWQFDESQYFIVEKKISGFMRKRNYPSVEDLVNELKLGNHNLINQVVETLAFSDTMFWRDAEVFAYFKNTILPEVKNKCRARKEIDVWSLGCSSGQETYSLAMIFDKCKKEFANWRINIFGSDVSGVAINKAQRGIYNGFEIQTGLNIRDIVNYFDDNGEQWQAKDFLRKMVDFRRYNMLDDIVGSDKFEVVFCRNVLRYFGDEYQENIIKRINEHQPQGGYLVLGKDEKISMPERYYQLYDKTLNIYIKTQQSSTSDYRGDNQIDVNDGKNSLAMPSFVRPQNL